MLGSPELQEPRCHWGSPKGSSLAPRASRLVHMDQGAACAGVWGEKEHRKGVLAGAGGEQPQVAAHFPKETHFPPRCKQEPTCWQPPAAETGGACPGGELIASCHPAGDSLSTSLAWDAVAGDTGELGEGVGTRMLS